MLAPVTAVLLIALGAIAICDIRTLHAPNRYLYPLIVLAVILSTTVSLAHAAEALLGGTFAFGLLLITALLGRGAMGYGDVKYSLVCGIVVGVGGVLPMLAFAFLLGGVTAAILLLTRRRGRRDVVAFTPFLFGGVLFALVWSQPFLLRG